MERQLLVTADDYGLSLGNVNTILEAVDYGSVTSLSILANGDAVEKGIEEYVQRSGHIKLSVHINLTEGRCVSEDPAIRILTNEDGMFRYSVGRLWVAYLFSRSRKREEFRVGVRAEVGAQIRKIRSLLLPHGLDISGADGHQHVHMIPFVFDVLVEEQLPYVRITHEPWYVIPHDIRALLGVHAIGRLALAFLSFRNRRIAKICGIEASRFFLGFVSSGKMTFESVKEGFHAVSLQSASTEITEVCFHPGSAQLEELDHWKNAETSWHHSSWRTHERALLRSDPFKTLCADFRADRLTEKRWYRAVPQMTRFLIAGSIATGTNLGLLYLFTQFFGIWYLISATIAYVISFFLSFVLQKFWTFAHTSLVHTRREMAWYALNNILGLLFDLIGVYLLVEYAHMWYMAAQFIILSMIALWNFFIGRDFIFKNKIHKTV